MLHQNDKFIASIRSCESAARNSSREPWNRKLLLWTRLKSYSEVGGFGFFDNLYYFNGRFYVLTPDSTAESITIERLRRQVLPDQDFPFTIVSIEDCNDDKNSISISSVIPVTVLSDMSWIALSAQRSVGFISHYFHFMEFILGLWAEQWLFWRSIEGKTTCC